MSRAPQQSRGQRGDREPRAEIGRAVRVALQPEIAPTAHPERAEERPEEPQRRDEQGAMEVAIEVVSGEAREVTMRDDGLTEPEERRREQRPTDEHASDVEQNSGRVLQGC